MVDAPVLTVSDAARSLRSADIHDVAAFMPRTVAAPADKH
jgi:hypothetical protein